MAGTKTRSKAQLLRIDALRREVHAQPEEIVQEVERRTRRTQKATAEVLNDAARMASPPDDPLPPTPFEPGLLDAVETTLKEMKAAQG